MVSQRSIESFDRGLQHERTALAWERTAISMMVSGVVLARYAARDVHMAIAFAGLLQTAFGGAILVWASWHYDDLHEPLRQGSGVVHPTAAKIVGRATVAFSGVGMTLALLNTFAG